LKAHGFGYQDDLHHQITGSTLFRKITELCISYGQLIVSLWGKNNYTVISRIYRVKAKTVKVDFCFPPQWVKTTERKLEPKIAEEITLN